MTQDEAAQRVIEELRAGVQRLDEVLGGLAADPGRALAEATWLGLRLAEQCQVYAEDVVHEGPEDERSFLSLDGALFKRNGELMNIQDAPFHTIVAAVLADQPAPAAG